MPLVRHRHGCGRAGRRPGRRRALILDLALLRPALELAVAVARAGAAADPAIEAPRALRPLLDFSRLRGPALATVGRVLDDDEGFRRRVAAAGREGGGESVVGRAGWLYLTRPDGWEEEVSGLSAARLEREDAGRDDRDERSARRRLRAAEDLARRAEERAAAAEAALAAATQEAAGERRARRDAEARVEALQVRVNSLERERDAAHRRASEAGKEVARLAAELAGARSQVGPVAGGGPGGGPGASSSPPE
ncbi:MAG TPA: hypothetical protein VFO65_13085, partial [Acidimicrobiales bacterium]|nr:hypothetical protein [Acidimicrobiales bacterium]